MAAMQQLLSSIGDGLWTIYSHDWGGGVVTLMTLGLLTYSGQRAISAYKHRTMQFKFPSDRIRFEEANRSELRAALMGVICAVLTGTSFGLAVILADGADVWFYIFVYGVTAFGVAGIVSAVVLLCADSQSKD
jgi:hypothetical protein